MAKIRRCFTAELRKYYLEAKCYYPDHIVNLFVLFIMFVGFFKLFSNSTERPNSTYYIGFVYWFYANGIIGESSMAISSEKQSGTFEQLLIKPTGLSGILFCRAVCWLLFQSVEIILVMSAIHVLFSIPMAFSWMVLPIFAITMLGLIGISYFLSALTLIFTKTASFISIASYLLLFFSGVVDGSNIQGFAYYVLPLSQGIYISRSIIEGNMVPIIDVGLLVLNSLAYLFAGLSAFHFVMRHGRKKGISMEY